MHTNFCVPSLQLGEMGHSWLSRKTNIPSEKGQEEAWLPVALGPMGPEELKRGRNMSRECLVLLLPQTARVVCVLTCTCVCTRVSPVNIGFAEDGFQAAVKLEEGHVLGGREKHQDGPPPMACGVSLPWSAAQRTPSAAPPRGGWTVSVQHQRSGAL